MILFLIASAIVYAGALPECSQDRYEACSDGDYLKGAPLTAEELDEYCSILLKQLDCQIDLSEKCPNAPFARFLEYDKFMKKGVVPMCDKNSSIRTKYLQNAICLNDITRRIDEYCEGPIDMSDFSLEEGCRRLRQNIKCLEDTVTDKCGEDSRDVLVATQDPDYQLRNSGCI